MAANPGTTVGFNFAGSNTLAEQINQGAPVDVFASADPKNMDVVKSEMNHTQTFGDERPRPSSSRPRIRGTSSPSKISPTRA